jgi:hypothetical protein
MYPIRDTFTYEPVERSARQITLRSRRESAAAERRRAVLESQWTPDPTTPPATRPALRLRWRPSRLAQA